MNPAPLKHSSRAVAAFYATWDTQDGGKDIGRPATWPGDTFGIAALPGTLPALVLTWGSAVSSASQIYSARITF